MVVWETEYRFLSLFFLMLPYLCSVSCNNEKPGVSTIPPTPTITAEVTIHNGTIHKLGFRNVALILFPVFQYLTLTCTANYPIRWDSTLPLHMYDLPKRFQNGSRNMEGLPKTFLYESSVSINISLTMNGFILCMKLGNLNVSSELMIYGGVTSNTIDSLQGHFSIHASIIKNRRCTDRVQVKIYRPVNTKLSYKDDPNFGLVIRNPYSDIRNHDFCSNEEVTWFIVSSTTARPESAEKDLQITDYLNQSSAVPKDCGELYCTQFSCTNPFHCSIAVKTDRDKATVCSPKFSYPGVQIYKCKENGRTKNVYMYSGVNGYDFPYNESSSSLMKISTSYQGEVYEDSKVNFTCSASSFLFGHQIVFGLRLKNNAVVYLDGFSKNETTLLDKGILTRTKSIHLGPEISEVICLAPTFDSNQWFNISFKVDLKFNVKSATEKSEEVLVGSNSILIAILCSILSVLLVLCIYFGFRISNAKKNLRDLSEQEIEQFRNGKYRTSVVRNSVSIAMTAQLVPFQNDALVSEIHIDTEKLIEPDTFISVSPATMRGITAIVKTTDEKTSVFFFKEFLKDIKVMNHISHPNIVPLLGAVTSKIQNRIIIVGFESSSLGNIKDFLLQNSGSCINLIAQNADNGPNVTSRSMTEGNQNQVTTLTMLHWSNQIATAMAYLQSDKLVHGDLSASNVYLFPENHIKISDLSSWRKAFERDYYLANYKPPPKWRWMAIELFRSMNFTTKTDMWAFGVTLWEIFSLGEDPLPGIKWSPGLVLELEKGYRMEKPAFATQEVYQMLLRCWYRYPNDRLNFVQIKGRIHECVEGVKKLLHQ